MGPPPCSDFIRRSTQSNARNAAENLVQAGKQREGQAVGNGRPHFGPKSRNELLKALERHWHARSSDRNAQSIGDTCPVRIPHPATIGCTRPSAIAQRAPGRGRTLARLDVFPDLQSIPAPGSSKPKRDEPAMDATIWGFTDREVRRRGDACATTSNRRVTSSRTSAS